jgi:putative DNA methylase
VNDPGYQQGGGFKYGKNKKEAAAERKRLFKIIEELVLWENTNNEEVLERARAEIRRSWNEVCELNKDHPQASELFNPNNLPKFYDPFGGSGAIPLEAQRLGLNAYASDLNPVAVLINKAMIEIPPIFAGRTPVHPFDQSQLSTINSQRVWPGAAGLAEDIRHYGAWIREEAYKRIGRFYPTLEITAAMSGERPDLKSLVGQKVSIVAWLWARTVKSPNPAFSDAQAYAEAISIYLSFAQDRLADYGCSLSTWRPKDSAMRSGLAKQALPMSWDFAEGNPFGDSSSGFTECVEVTPATETFRTMTRRRGFRYSNGLTT